MYAGNVEDVLTTRNQIGTVFVKYRYFPITQLPVSTQQPSRPKHSLSASLYVLIYISCCLRLLIIIYELFLLMFDGDDVMSCICACLCLNSMH